MGFKVWRWNPTTSFNNTLFRLQVIIYVVTFKLLTMKGICWIKLHLTNTCQMQFGSEQGVLSATTIDSTSWLPADVCWRFHGRQKAAKPLIPVLTKAQWRSPPSQLVPSGTNQRGWDKEPNRTYKDLLLRFSTAHDSCWQIESCDLVLNLHLLNP